MPPQTATSLAVSDVSALLAVCNVWCCLRVPPGWAPDTEQQSAAVQEVKKKVGRQHETTEQAALKRGNARPAASAIGACFMWSF